MPRLAIILGVVAFTDRQAKNDLFICETKYFCYFTGRVIKLSIIKSRIIVVIQFLGICIICRYLLLLLAGV